MKGIEQRERYIFTRKVALKAKRNEQTTRPSSNNHVSKLFTLENTSLYGILKPKRDSRSQQLSMIMRVSSIAPIYVVCSLMITLMHKYT